MTGRHMYGIPTRSTGDGHRCTFEFDSGRRRVVCTCGWTTKWMQSAEAIGRGATASFSHLERQTVPPPATCLPDCGHGTFAPVLASAEQDEPIVSASTEHVLTGLVDEWSAPCGCHGGRFESSFVIVPCSVRCELYRFTVAEAGRQGKPSEHRMLGRES